MHSELKHCVYLLLFIFVCVWLCIDLCVLAAAVSA